MHRFWSTHIRPILDALQARTVCEIGVQSGAGTRQLIRWADGSRARIHSIDPELPAAWPEIADEFERVGTYHAKTSLEALPGLEPCDAYLIDGDHNHYTVSSELELIDGAVEGAPCVVFLHDVGWPYGRRDLYYEPSRIPDDRRQAWARRGLLPGQSDLAEEGGLNGHLANAAREGGPANGVLTAVEDFATGRPGWEMAWVPGLHGLAYLWTSACEDEVRAAIRERTDLSAPARALVEVVEGDRVEGLAQAETRRRELEASRAEAQRRLASTQKQLAAARAELSDLKNRRAHRYAEKAREVVRFVRRLTGPGSGRSTET